MGKKHEHNRKWYLKKMNDILKQISLLEKKEDNRDVFNKLKDKLAKYNKSYNRSSE